MNEELIEHLEKMKKSMDAHEVTLSNEKLQQWKEALLSGNYRQGRGHLRTTDEKYCCIGVYAEAVCNIPLGEYEENDLITSTLDIFGKKIDKESKSFFNEVGYRFANLNDDVSLSFLQIAEIIHNLQEE